MDIGSAFTFVTQDEDWIKKILIAAVLTMFGIAGFIVMGWAMEIARRVINEEEELLPDWDDFGKYAINGLKYIVVVFVYALPLILISACGGIVGAFTADDYQNVSTIITICSSLLTFVLALLVAFIAVPAFGILAETGDIGTAIKEAFPTFRLNIGGFILAALVAGIVISVLSTVGLILCVIGTFFTTAYGNAFMGHLYGQAYKNAKANADLAGLAAPAE